MAYKKLKTNEYKWDLGTYIKDEKMLEAEFEYLQKNYGKFADFYGKFGDEDNLKKYLDFSEKFNMRAERLAMYIYHNLNTDISDRHFLVLKQKFEFLSSKIDQTTAFISPQLHELDDEYLNLLLKDKKFVTYKREIEKIIKNKPHKLDERDAKLLSKMSLFTNASEELRDTLCDSEISFSPAADSKGKKHEVTLSNFILYLSSNDRELRKNAFFSLFNGFKNFNKTLSIAMNKNVMQDVFSARLTNFDNCLQQALFYEEVPEIVYDNLIKNVNKNVNLLHKLVAIRKKLLNLNKIAYYDLFVPINKSSKKYSIETAKEMVMQAVSPLGEEYKKLLEDKYLQKSIDFLPKKNKVSGAYSSGSYGCPSIVLMNFENNIESVFTLAHELGHCLHSELSNANQPYHLADYTIFSAEVASITNEILMYEYLVQATKSKKEITDLTLDLLDKFRSTIFRQTMFAEFEQFTHETIEKEEPLTYVQLNEKFYELNKKYYGSKIELPQIMETEWSRIPHFYSSYYVYKYATGFITALAIVKKIKSDEKFYNKYLQFLKSGKTKPSVELLQDIGVDLTTDQPFDLAFKYMADKISLLENK